MPNYPIYVPRNDYRGNNAAKRLKSQEHNRLAQAMEKYVNEKIKTSTSFPLMISYGEIAGQLQLELKAVQDIMYGVDAGSNGITIFNGKD